jgi:hypothetical protein
VKDAATLEWFEKQTFTGLYRISFSEKQEKLTVALCRCGDQVIVGEGPTVLDAIEQLRARYHQTDTGCAKK